jgi:hypothetical protein
MARRTAAPPRVADLLSRLAGVEQRLRQLETGRVGPGDGRAAAVKRPREVRRCPGCGLPLRRRNGRCLACKRPLDSI